MTLRLFVAAPLSEETRRQIEAAIAPMRRSLPPASWTRSESLHLTFAFVGDREEVVAQLIGQALGTALQDELPFEMRVRGCGFFPSERRPRVAWLGLEPRDALEGIAGKIRQTLRSRSVDFDDSKKYVPHLTVARLRDFWPSGATAEFIRTLSGFATSPSPLDSVVLYSSQLSPRGAVHRPLRIILLGEARKNASVSDGG